MDIFDALLLLLGGFCAGVVNTLAGGGSLLTVPLLHFVGLPGTLANGTNRFGVLLQSGVAGWRFRSEGVPGFRAARALLLPVASGALLGAWGIVQLEDAFFERAFGVLMLLLLVPTLRAPESDGARQPHKPLPTVLRVPLFFVIGLYGGSFQAGVGLLLIYAIRWSGVDWVRTNSMKVVLNFCFTLLVLPIFLLSGQMHWSYALVLGAGFAAGGAAGARLAVRGGEKWIRLLLALTVPALAGQMLGLYG